MRCGGGGGGGGVCASVQLPFGTCSACQPEKENASVEKRRRTRLKFQVCDVQMQVYVFRDYFSKVVVGLDWPGHGMELFIPPDVLVSQCIISVSPKLQDVSPALKISRLRVVDKSLDAHA